AASSFTDLAMPEQAAVVSELAPDRIRVLGAFIGPDEIADLLQELEGTPAREYLLNALPPTLASSALELVQYEEDDAGG
ncbi:MAG: magnesium transporter, partial [Pleurocapsa sp. SU_196_0]|nr:magnesium transporter [Pleurocapsa sp. SU_196_0]